MDIKELRIGNLVYSPISDQIEEVCILGISQRVHTYSDEFERKSNSHHSYSNSYCLEGIPITKDWLMKFGFSEKNDSFELIIRGFNILFDEDMECWIESIGLDIIHIHQLQNPIHILTGQEFKVEKEIQNHEQ